MFPHSRVGSTLADITAPQLGRLKTALTEPGHCHCEIAAQAAFVEWEPTVCPSRPRVQMLPIPFQMPAPLGLPKGRRCRNYRGLCLIMPRISL